MKLSCDICGRPDARAIILIEGAKMMACGGCMRSGKVLHHLGSDDEENKEILKSQSARAISMGESEEIVEGFGKIIRKARDKIGLGIGVIAERINERESFIDAIENERLAPTLEIARKLQRELGIKLIEKVEKEVTTEIQKKGKFSEPTLADALFFEKNKKAKQK
jgi:putative transcription factor